MKRLFDMIVHAVDVWLDRRASSMGAALAFYSAFSLAPLLVIVIAVAGAFLGADAVRGAIVDELTGALGSAGAEAVQSLLKAAYIGESGLLATALSVIALLVGATSMLVELQEDLDLIWRSPPRTTSGIWNELLARALSLGMILVIGFLLLVSLVVSTAMAALVKYWGAFFPAWGFAAAVGHEVISLAVTAGLFAMLFKWLPNAAMRWSDAWFGGIVTALLFELGHFALGLYLGRTAVASAYGAVGTLVVLLLWLYYSAQIFLFGAVLTWLRSERRRAGVTMRVPPEQ